MRLGFLGSHEALSCKRVRFFCVAFGVAIATTVPSLPSGGKLRRCVILIRSLKSTQVACVLCRSMVIRVSFIFTDANACAEALRRASASKSQSQ